ncbi:polysaccharide pyruvyl transferase family protein [Prescottella equi]|uniref:polysaccharide pyruvyl transferase family protein n=1 Tax=Rhodococcus hoagii TaxID=43767 RepID=UPI002740C621|nr:polysaccharide pyruvyl transferase family protein [Prescottella equi]MDP8016039.1 polysaccharide pyruvyl transferase family protein [Prescottella equi]
MTQECNVGILTLTQSENYGTVLQAYATHHLLNSEPSSAAFSLVPTDVSSVRRRRVLSLLNPRNPSSGTARIRNFLAMRKFIEPYVYAPGRSWVDISNREAAVELLDARFDGFVTGSDEVWNLAFVGDKSIYYAPASMGQVRASFATSANRLDISKLTGNERDTLRRSLESYSLITVRDSNTRQFVEDLLGGGIDVEEVVDPTLIHGLSDFVRVHRTAERSGRRRILMMVKDRAVGERLISRMGSTVEIDSIFVRYPGTRYLVADPAEFVGAFGAYDCVVTDFFHATCMSVLSKSPFVSFDSEPLYAVYESKISNLLAKLGLLDRYVNLADHRAESSYRRLFDAIEGMLAGPPVWTADAALESERNRGLAVAQRIRATMREGLASAR